MFRPPSRSLPLATIAVAITAAGCASRGSVELVEARLRDQEDRNAQLAAELERTREEIRVARQDADDLRAQLVGRGERVLLPEQADALFRARELRINAMLTAGVDADGQPGDEAITTVVTPVDASGRPIRLPGELVVVMTPADGDTPLQRWTLSPEESRHLWQRDLLAGGFRLQLPLQMTPPTENVRISARLKTADGRELEASHAFALRLGESAADVPVPEPRPLEFSAEENPFEVEALGAAADDPNPPAGVRPASIRFAPPDGSDDPNGNGLDRTAPARTSDRFRFEDGNVPRYN